MMKILTAVFWLFLMVCMVSCELDDYTRIGEIMGNLGNNVYGLKADMEQVDGATEKIDDSVEKDSEGNITVNLDEAAKIIDDITEISNSSQKTEALKEEMQKPACDNEEDAAKLQTALNDKMDDVLADLSSAKAGISDENVKELIDSVSESIESIKNNIGSNPSKGDLAAVAIVNQLAEMAKTADTSDKDALLETADKAFTAVDALKVVSDVSDIDLIGDLDLGSLISSKGVSKGDDEDDGEEYLKVVSPVIRKILSAFSDEDGFNREKYDSFILQSKVIVETYDFAAWAVNRYAVPDFSQETNWFRTLDDILDSVSTGKMTLDQDLSINDMSMYLVSFLMSSLDDTIRTLNNTSDIVTGYKLYEKYIGALEDFVRENREQTGIIRTTSLETNPGFVDEFTEACKIKCSSESWSQADLISKLLLPKLPGTANTIGIILIKSGYIDVNSLLKSSFKDGESLGTFLTRSINEAIEDFAE